jgi:hypothetical protein
MVQGVLLVCELLGSLNRPGVIVPAQALPTPYPLDARRVTRHAGLIGSVVRGCCLVLDSAMQGSSTGIVQPRRGLDNLARCAVIRAEESRTDAGDLLGP